MNVLVNIRVNSLWLKKQPRYSTILRYTNTDWQRIENNRLFEGKVLVVVIVLNQKHPNTKLHYCKHRLTRNCSHYQLYLETIIPFNFCQDTRVSFRHWKHMSAEVPIRYTFPHSPNHHCCFKQLFLWVHLRIWENSMRNAENKNILITYIQNVGVITWMYLYMR